MSIRSGCQSDIGLPNIYHHFISSSCHNTLTINRVNLTQAWGFYKYESPILIFISDIQGVFSQVALFSHLLLNSRKGKKEEDREQGAGVGIVHSMVRLLSRANRSLK